MREGGWGKVGNERLGSWGSGDGGAPERVVAFESEEIGEPGGIVRWGGEDDSGFHGGAGESGESGDWHCH